MPSRAVYLKAMGIDVWSRRVNHLPPVIPPVVNDVMPVEAKPQTVPQESRPESPQTREVPRFRIGFIHYQTFSVCVQMEEGQDFPRRLADDLARFMGGSIESPKFQEVTWPMLNTSGIDQSIDTAREVVTGKIGLLADRVVIVGTGLSAYFPAASKLDAWQPALVGRQSMLLIPSFRELAPADAKRRLLQIMDQWRR